LAVQEQQSELRSNEAGQLTAAQRSEVGPVEEDAAMAILKENEGEAATVLAHNGEDGLITRGSGALSFRIGDFFSGKDVEQMRLTTEGNLGIGITHPQARLDVDGFIRASQGIMFPDGTIQTTAANADSSSHPTTGQQTTGPGLKPWKLGKASGGTGKGQST